MTSLLNSYAVVVNQIAALQQHARYEGAFVFGSYVTGELHDNSDLDVVVLVTDADGCREVSHPLINGIPVDISFFSYGQIQRYLQETLARNFRPKPWLYASQILFDKQGRLHKLAHWVQETAQPAKYSQADYEDIQLSCYYFLAKAQKCLEREPTAALLVMMNNLNDLLRYHYRIHGRWRVADKRMLGDLAKWDHSMEKLLRSFLTEVTVGQKFALWTQMIDHLLTPIGGRNFAKYENVCHCERCQNDLQAIMKVG
jgi:Polymerase beta, Nucleotidyltransferase